ncbi:terpene synthase family protein [Actinophytocola sp.]|uniref:terpene synthase family protein n=1 Tax=Actinophytocola sp. TaxID=1872138 RepID=UPI002D7ED630|nr:hypothetical protein [Actinophytocola sp.]HET9138304.1 hypothetical protein [Actinophytocola sp.]
MEPLAALIPPASPFPSRISPYAAQAEREVRAYLRRCGLLPGAGAADYYFGSRLGYLTAQIYPDALPDRLPIVARWFCVWTMFDDQLEKLPDERPAAAVRLVADAMLTWLGLRLAPPDPHVVPFQAGFGGAWADLRRLSSPVWQRRFLTHTEQYLDGCLWEATNRYTGTVPTLKSYIEQRRRFGGIRAAMDLSEFATGYELPERVHDDPLTQDLLDVLGDITLWGNDLFSVGVDAEEGNVSNLVFVLQRHLRCGVDNAATAVSRMLVGRLRLLRRLESRLPRCCAALRLTPTQCRDVGRFVAGMHTWISGNIAWSRDNTRYRSSAPRVGGSQPNFLLALVPG